MTFLSGWRLVLLVAPVVLLVAYLLVQRRRHAQVLEFTSVDLLDSVAPRRSGWARHVPAVALLASLVVMVLAFAQPVMVQRVAKDRATIMLTLDTSASMMATDVSPNRLQAAADQARSFVKGLPAGIQVGLVTFDANARLVVPPSTDTAPVLDALDQLRLGGGTATAAGIRTSLAAVQGLPPGDTRKPAPAVIVLMSDGAPTIADDGTDDPIGAAERAAADAKAASVPVDTIAFGTAGGEVTVQGRTVPVPYDPQTMQQIASTSGGQSFTAETADQLGSIYDAIGRDVAFVEQTKEVTALFVGGALLLALLAAAGALAWTQRLV